jgi:hypothetical protein
LKRVLNQVPIEEVLWIDLEVATLMEVDQQVSALLGVALVGVH